jgi:spermidine synthase
MPIRDVDPAGAAQRADRGKRRPAAARPPADQPTLSEADGVRYLHFDSEWIQGAMDLQDPVALVLEYTTQMMAWLLFVDPPREERIGLLGLGAGSLARFCLKHTSSNVLAVEWNAQVTAVCRMFFRLPATPRLDVVHEDAADWVADRANAGACPVLLVDLYDAQARGPVRDSLDFYRDCRSVVGEPGVLVVNLFGDHASFPRNIERIRTAFDGRVVLLPEIDAGNRIALAFAGPAIDIPVTALLDRAAAVEARYGLPARRWARSLIRKSDDGRLRI